MSKGKLIKPRNLDYPDNQLERNVYDIVHKVIPQYEVDVTNEDWQNADEELKEELTEIDNQIRETIDSLKENISSIENRLGNNEGNLSDELVKIKSEIESIKVRKPIE